MKTRFAGVPVLLSLCFIGITSPATAQLETRSIAPTNSYPNSIVVADFNGDGVMDFAVSSYYSYLSAPGIQVYLGKGDGTFGSPVPYHINQGAGPLVVGDLNHDGKLDIITGSEDGVNVLMGNGDGTFQAPVAYSTPPGPGAIVLGDFNGDGNLDVATVDTSNKSSTCDCVSVLLGAGNGTFREPAIITYLPISYPRALAAGYFDTQSRNLDLAVTLSFISSGAVQILLGNGDGTFTLGASYGTETVGYSIVAADLRNNGETDLAVGEFNGPGVGVLLGNGDGTFEEPVVYEVNTPLALAVGDVNNDGVPDMVAAAAEVGYGAAVVLLGNGDGTFQNGEIYPAGQFPNSVVIADFNGDHLLDVMLEDQSSPGHEYVMLNTGVVSFSPTTGMNFPTQLVGTTSAPLTTTLNNQGRSALTISSVSFGGAAFKSSTTCKGSVAPGGSCTITATFTPAAQGSSSGVVTIVDSASSKPQVIPLVGTGTVVEFSPNGLAFPAQAVGTTSAPQTMLLINTGSTGLNITGNFLYVGGTDYADFQQSNNCPVGGTLAAGGSCSITVTFTPTKTGTRNANITVTDTGGGSPQTPTLTGTGTLNRSEN